MKNNNYKKFFVIKLHLIFLISVLALLIDARSKTKTISRSIREILSSRVDEEDIPVIKFNTYKRIERSGLETTTRKIINTANDTRKGVCILHRAVFSSPVPRVHTTEINLFTDADCCAEDMLTCHPKSVSSVTIPYVELDMHPEGREEEVCCDGFVRHHDMFDSQGRIICVPGCSKPCVFGNCLGKNKCKCIKGYAKENRKKSSNVCVPFCKSTCKFGKCVAPNVCECNIGFKSEAIDRCVTHCPVECINSTCVGPSTCKCKKGYKPHPTDQHVCVPLCSACHRGHCIAPDQCICPDKYDFVNGNCFPKCEHYCGEGGRCKQKSTRIKCKCHENYKYDKRKQICVPICDHCEGGTCIKPNECQCNPGYQDNGEGGCKFVCQIECGWGRCVGENKCKCNKGYQFNATAKDAKCVPHCPGCEIGQCLSPNRCQCPNGYVYAIPKKTTETEHRCIKTVPEYKYYDHEDCKSLYVEKKKQDKLNMIQDKKAKEKKRKEDERKQRIREFKERIQKETERKEMERKNNEKMERRKQILRQAKTEWLKKQEKDFLRKQEEEKQQEEKLQENYKKYVKDNEEPSVTWRNFARVAVASLIFGPIGIVFW